VAHASFNGLRVLSLESRRAKEVEKLIRTYGGEPIVVPSMREVGLESNQQALEFASGILAGSYDLVIFMTGVGVRAMLRLSRLASTGRSFLLRCARLKSRLAGRSRPRCCVN
jgi:uroporphyrinogen-III synthase